MAEYDNRNTFTLFRNSRKQKDTHPDFNGTFTDADGRNAGEDAQMRCNSQPPGVGYSLAIHQNQIRYLLDEPQGVENSGDLTKRK